MKGRLLYETCKDHLMSWRVAMLQEVGKGDSSVTEPPTGGLRASSGSDNGRSGSSTGNPKPAKRGRKLLTYQVRFSSV